MRAIAWCVCSLTAITPRRPEAGAGGAFAKHNPTPGQIIGRHLDLDAIADHRADAETPHLAGGVGDDLVVILQLDAEAPVGENF